LVFELLLGIAETSMSTLQAKIVLVLDGASAAEDTCRDVDMLGTKLFLLLRFYFKRD
jgi:hypothetical protein